MSSYSFLSEATAAKPKRKTVRILNQTQRDYCWPPISNLKLRDLEGFEGFTEDLPRITLVCNGITTVPSIYLEAVEALFKAGRCPGLTRDIYRHMTDEVQAGHMLNDGIKAIPLVILEETDPRYARKDGPKPPDNLKAYGNKVCEALIESEVDRDVLENWRRADDREEIKTAINARLASIPKE
jgi:hypothetical protein